MHELSLAESAIELIESVARKERFKRVRVEHLEVGALSCVEPAALAFAFQSTSLGTCAEGARLNVLHVPGEGLCPAAFDLGEAHKVVVLSVTEGEDKPLKYPDMFRAADLMLLNKCDLLPHLNFDVAAAIGYAQRVNPGLRVQQVSATTGVGMDERLAWLLDGAARAQ